MKNLLALLLTWPLFAATVHNGQTFVTSFNKNFFAPTSYTTIGHIAIVPISYYAIAKKITITIDGKPFVLTITPKNYPKERLRVVPSKVKPPQEVRKQIEKEFAEAKKIYTYSSAQNYITKPFILPLQSSITSQFGTARLFNGQLKSYHSGTDFKAKVGTPVHAINDGVVVLAKERYYAGGSVIIDHGRGIYSCYYHLSKFKVKPGDIVKRGEIVGLSGKSGRVTGPHLHLTIKIKNVTVDPLQFIKAFNKIFRTQQIKELFAN